MSIEFTGIVINELLQDSKFEEAIKFFFHLDKQYGFIYSVTKGEIIRNIFGALKCNNQGNLASTCLDLLNSELRKFALIGI